MEKCQRMDFLISKSRYTIILYVLLSLGVYGYVAYGLMRENTASLLLAVGMLFVLLWRLQKVEFSWKTLLLLGVLFRMVFLGTWPQLSPDFYRYLWDGNIMLMGFNPYAHSPNTLFDLIQFPQASLLYEKMGSLSQSNLSNYPPLSQYIFKAMAFFSQKTLLPGLSFLRLLYGFIELFIFLVGRKFLEKLGFNNRLLGWYFLNPLLIIETYGNLHGEGLMMSFFLLGIGLLFQQKIFASAFFISLSIAFKLFPLLFLPLFYFFLKPKERFFFYITLLLVLVLCFGPFATQSTLINYWNTLRLWFDTFEFNASIYYVIRTIGFQLVDYNIIKQVGVVMPFIIFLWVGYLSLKNKVPTQKQLLKHMLWVGSLYFFLATTVHPWYIIILLPLGILSGYLFPVLWSFTVFWSYSAYQITGVNESFTFITLEYFFVFVCMGFELYKKPLLKHL